MFVRLRWWKLLLFAVWPPAKRAWEARLKEGIEWYMQNPQPVVFYEPKDAEGLQ